MKIFKFNIFYKVLLFSILTLISVAVMGALTAKVIYNSDFHSKPESFTMYMGELIGRYGIDSAASNVLINDIDRVFGYKIGVFDTNGSFIKGDSNFFPVKLEKTPDNLKKSKFYFGWHRKVKGYIAPFTANSKDYYLLVSDKERGKGPKTLLLLAVVFSILIMIAYIFSKTLISPLSKISAVVKGFGKGDFTVRTNLCRNDEIGDLAKSFNDMADKINHLIKSEKELLANISHEIRTPLSRIRIALEISEEVDKIDQIRRYLSGIDMDIVELEQLIEDVLTSTKLDFALNHQNGTALILREEPSDLMEIIHSSILRFNDHYEERVLETDFDSDSYKVSIDKKLIKRVVDNLLDNAVKYSDSGNIKINILSDKEYVYTEVIDKGVGLSTEDLESIFNPFYRAEKSRVKSRGGIGLGLTLCQRILKAHGEEIQVESILNQGSTFIFRLKLLV
ncbi:MAG: HAMP domain-containing histidine kinase [Desulfobacterales bacterium]|nr:HAMP domain-containing histidine kinase [Desulfobacterales bacterium]MCP4161149.1 HAMP domain-containing histidine kinase [Deltaproteobacteria bacterium]